MKQETLDRIDRYLHEEMTDGEKVAFEKDLANDDVLREQVELTEKIVEAVEVRNMKEYLATLDKVEHRRKTIWRIVGGLSAVAACLLIGVFFIHTGNESFSIPPRMSSDYGFYERGGSYVQDVVKLLENNKYEQALVLIDSLEIVCKSEDSLLPDNKDRTEEEAYRHESDSIALYQLGWLRIQTLISQRKQDKVRELLESYRLQEGEYREKADSLWILFK